MLAVQFEAMASFDRSTAVQNWNSPLATVILFLFHSAWTLGLVRRRPKTCGGFQQPS